MIKFPSIDQFRQIVREVRTNHDYKGKNELGEAYYLHDSPYPTIQFKGTVKLHGTNAAIVHYKDGRTEYQSRERVLSLTQDNAGFMLAMMGRDTDAMFDGIEFNEYCAYFGEWCGGNIQKGVAICQLPKMFVIFAVNIDGDWRELPFKNNLTYITDFPNYTIDIDFNNPELSQNILAEITEKVEECCPVGQQLGVTGIGEGVVWKAKHGDHFYQFKVKGEKHSVSKVKTLASVNVEMLTGIKEFVDTVVTENRLQQSLKETGAVDRTQTSDFIRWVVKDVLKEETDTIIQNQFDMKKVTSGVGNKAREWFFKTIA